MYKQLIERMQHRFLRFGSYKLDTPMDVPNHDYSQVTSALNLISLESRRTIADLFFLFKIVNYRINRGYLSGLLAFSSKRVTLLVSLILILLLAFALRPINTLYLSVSMYLSPNFSRTIFSNLFSSIYAPCLFFSVNRWIYCP